MNHAIAFTLGCLGTIATIFGTALVVLVLVLMVVV
jgi:hypothetical protein